MSKGTIHRTVRIEDGLWEAAKAEAKNRGDNLSDVIRRALDKYSKPQLITSEEELAALPVGAVVLSEPYTHYKDGMRIAFQKWPDEAWHRGARSGSTHPDNFLPVTVLHKP